jgi:hypothetical protein
VCCWGEQFFCNCGMRNGFALCNRNRCCSVTILYLNTHTHTHTHLYTYTHTYLGIGFFQDALAVPSQYRKQGILEAQDQQHHEAGAVHVSGHCRPGSLDGRHTRIGMILWLCFHFIVVAVAAAADGWYAYVCRWFGIAAANTSYHGCSRILIIIMSNLSIE